MVQSLKQNSIHSAELKQNSIHGAELKQENKKQDDKRRISCGLSEKEEQYPFEQVD